MISAAFDNGTCIISNGGGGEGKRRLYCNAFFQELKTSQDEAPVTYRNSSLHEKNNTRGKAGQSMPRQTVSYQAYSNEDPFKMYFNFTWDDKEY